MTGSNLAAIEALCAAIPGLERQGEGLWVNRTERGVSYPEHGLEILAAIEDRSYWFQHRNAVIETVMRHYPPPDILLDIGGGNGVVSRHLLGRGIPSMVVEPGAAGAAVAVTRGVPAIRSAFQDLKVPEGLLGAAGMFDVLEHIEDDAGMLGALNRALRSGGMLYIAVPAHSWLWSPQDTDSGHFRRYTVGSLSARLKEAGFEPMFGTYFFSALVPAVLLFRSLPGYLGWKRSTNDARQVSADHSLPDGPIGRAIAASFARELRSLAAKRRVSVGTSCLVVARKR
jgi:hypothetical protein